MNSSPPWRVLQQPVRGTLSKRGISLLQTPDFIKGKSLPVDPVHAGKYHDHFQRKGTPVKLNALGNNDIRVAAHGLQP